jgi:hypothetical protein
MVGIFRRIWSALWLRFHSGVRPGQRSGLRRNVGQMPTPSRSSVSPVAGALTKAHLPKAALSKARLPEDRLPEAHLPDTRPAKLFYSLMIEISPEEADAETSQLFSGEACFTLSDALSLPTGCKLRRCMYVSTEFAEMLIRM